MIMSLNIAAQDTNANHQEQFFSTLRDKNLASYFISAGNRYEEEQLILGASVRNLLALNKSITNKNIIFSLLTMLSCSDDVVTSDIIRHTLEIVMQHTHDDM